MGRMPHDVQRTYRHRIYPTRGQWLALEAQLGFACELYNAALEQRREAWRRQPRSINYVAQCRDLTELRAAGLGPPEMNWHAMRDPLRRLDRAFAAFFRRLKAGEKPGYPRFRSRRRYDSLTWDSGWALREGRLALQGIGHIKVKWHRSIPETAVVRCVTVRRVAGRWYACFAVELSLPVPATVAPRRAVGVDLGILSFATLSTGEQVRGPRAYRSAMRRLWVAQRRVARRVRGSRGRQKAVRLLARTHERVRNIRRDHAHKLTRRLVSDFGVIAVEDLNVRGLVRGMLAKDVSDQGWSEFLRMLRYKAEEAGSQVISVPPGGSSQACSGCSVVVPKPLSERIHRCPDCGLVIDRDINAARNLLRLGLSRQASTWPTGACVA